MIRVQHAAEMLLAVLKSLFNRFASEHSFIVVVHLDLNSELFSRTNRKYENFSVDVVDIIASVQTIDELMKVKRNTIVITGAV